MNNQAFSIDEMKAFRSFIKKIHPDKNIEEGPTTRKALTWLTAHANQLKDKGDWFKIANMIKLLDTEGMEGLLAWAHEMLAKEKQEQIDYLAIAREYMAHDNYSRSEVSGWLKRKYGLKGAEAAAILDELFAKPKTEKHGRVDNLALMVELFRLNVDKLTKQDLLKLVVEQTGYTHSTVNHFYNAINFAKEWSKQSS